MYHLLKWCLVIANTLGSKCSLKHTTGNWLRGSVLHRLCFRYTCIIFLKGWDPFEGHKIYFNFHRPKKISYILGILYSNAWCTLSVQFIVQQICYGLFTLVQKRSISCYYKTLILFRSKCCGQGTLWGLLIWARYLKKLLHVHTGYDYCQRPSSESLNLPWTCHRNPETFSSYGTHVIEGPSSQDLVGPLTASL